MSSRKTTEPPPQPTPVAAPAPRVPAKPGTSGRVQFDERGQAVWEWNVDTGKFERTASTARVRALTDAAGKLELEDTSATGTSSPGGAPSDSSKVGGAESANERNSPSCDPYSRGPSRSPESVTFNPHHRGVRPKR